MLLIFFCVSYIIKINLLYNRKDEDNVIIDIESENEDKEMKLHSYKSQRNVAKLDNKYKNFIKTGKSPRPMMDKNEEIKNSRCKLSSFRPKSK